VESRAWSSRLVVPLVCPSINSLGIRTSYNALQPEAPVAQNAGSVTRIHFGKSLHAGESITSPGERACYPNRTASLIFHLQSKTFIDLLLRNGQVSGYRLATTSHGRSSSIFNSTGSRDSRSYNMAPPESASQPTKVSAVSPFRNHANGSATQMLRQ
jgi:hypothetical protein